jgi:hypothetical protein
MEDFNSSQSNKKEIPDFENVVGLFNLLYKIDKRNNPHLYQNNKEENNDRHNSVIGAQRQGVALR